MHRFFSVTSAAELQSCHTPVFFPFNDRETHLLTRIPLPLEAAGQSLIQRGRADIESTGSRGVQRERNTATHHAYASYHARGAVFTAGRCCTAEVVEREGAVRGIREGNVGSRHPHSFNHNAICHDVMPLPFSSECESIETLWQSHITSVMSCTFKPPI